MQLQNYKEEVLIKTLVEGLLVLLMSPREGQCGCSIMELAITLFLGYFSAHFTLFHLVGNGSNLHHLSYTGCVESYSDGAKVLHRYTVSSMV